MLLRSRFLRYIFVAHSLGLSSTVLTKITLNATEFGKIMAITPFKVIQGHHFRYQWKACTRQPISHRFQDILDYWSIFLVSTKGCSTFTHSLGNELRILECEIWSQETWDIVLSQCAKYLTRSWTV